MSTLWILALLQIAPLACRALSEQEMKLLKSAASDRPNLRVNGDHTSQFEVTEEREGLITITTNARPGYVVAHSAQRQFRFNIRKEPKLADEPNCIPVNEPVGVTMYGTLIYSVLLGEPGCPQADEQKVRNGIPGGQEVTEFDECGGLVSRKDALYRVYTFSTCLAKLTCGQEAEMIGVALDGFPIYGPIDETGRQLTSRDLDECHGKLGPDGNYRYYATVDYPYFVSCFRGSLHREVGITFPVRCTCPYTDAGYILPNRLPFPNYTIAYEWVSIFQDLALFPCNKCTSIKSDHTESNVKSWLNYKALAKQVTDCNTTTETRFTQVIKRRLSPGRLPPDKEYEYYANLKKEQRDYIHESDTSSSEAPVVFTKQIIRNLITIQTLFLLWTLFS